MEYHRAPLGIIGNGSGGGMGPHHQSRSVPIGPHGRWHGNIYGSIVKKLGLKHCDDDANQTVAEKFTLEGWVDRLIRWIAVDDQSINVVDCEEFRDFVLFGRDETDKDLPHRTTLTDRIFKKYAERAEGRIHYTGDVWSKDDLSSHFAISGHFCMRDANGNLIIANRLVAFRVVDGKHDGENLAKIAIGILKEAGILHQSGMWTLDSASNNGTFMFHLGRLIAAEPRIVVEFDAEEKTPTLSMALPAFELLLKSWLQMQQTLPELAHYIGVGIAKIQEYVNKGRKSRIYALAMIINPTMKMHWIEENWPVSDALNAEEWMIEVFVQPSPPIPPILSPAEEAELERQALEDDRRAAIREFSAYKSEPLVSSNSSQPLNLVRYWDVNSEAKPLLFKVACDVLPVQASSRRNRLQATLFEALQLMKYSYKQDRLSFTDDVLAKEEDYTIEGTLTEAAIRELMQTGKTEELGDLLRNMTAPDEHAEVSTDTR
ncbi:Dimer-Tnp-hAT domain-containing protein [Mycena venus]|uniref:Dimer-Tnp-hAT domain-containing protein n=1 Tax=Mycena venus TaxID=2733690 RepID=A0A8H7DHK7_9AGAR|nr:Dimer-Tnp-hAT domain-containing protein [Mycena venus]